MMSEIGSLSRAASEDLSAADNILRSGHEVLATEAAALGILSSSLDDSFVAAVELLLGTAGRIVVSGIGKSGHIGRKIAASFASTGAPAFFLHAGEAGHGDLGMLTPDDVLLLLSFSGETRELVHVAQYAGEVGVAAVSIGSRPDSTLMRAAAIKLVLPPLREACPENISPTTSAIMMLAMGDALAVAMMNVRGVSLAKLNSLHPGGNIGSRFTPVSTLMHDADSLPLVALDAPMRDVIVTMTACSFGVAGVVDAAGRLVGAITDGDLRRHIDELQDATAGQVMTPAPMTVDADSVAEDALSVMRSSLITALFVTEAHAPETPVGLLHVHDLLRAGLG